MPSQPSIDLKAQPSHGRPDMTSVPREHRSNAQSNRPDNPTSVSGLQIVQDQMGIPVKANANSGGKPNGIPLEGEQQSERSDAGTLIVR